MEPAVAILLFQVSQNRNFIHDDLVPALSSALAREGVPNDIFETVLPPIGDGGAEDLSSLDALAAQIQGKYPVCAYVRLWSETVFQRLRELLPGVVWVYLGDPRVAFTGTTHSIALGQVGTLAALARAAAQGVTPPPEAFAIPPIALERAHKADNLTRITLGRERRPDRPAVVHGSPGCAYGQDVRENPFFKDVPFPENGRVVLRGCSFCATGGVPRLPAGEVLRSALDQLDHILATEPDTARVQINDQNPFPYLVPFVERAAERAGRPLEILIETRADWFLGAMPVMERALQSAERAGHRVLLFLMGLENLSQKELDLYNKGVTVEQNERAVHECRRLKKKYPRSYSDTPAAFGFVLYNPWTELGDLRLNLAAVERTGLTEFRGQIARSKLRLYPDTALYYKALHEGLVTERFPYEAMDSARRYGYEAEVPWRFKHAATDRAYGVHDVIFRKAGKHEELKMLDAIVRWLERHPARWGDPVELLARDIVRSLGPRFTREIRHDPAPDARPTEPARRIVAPPRPEDHDAWKRASQAARNAVTAHEALAACGLELTGELTGPERSAVRVDPDRVQVPRLEELAFEVGIKPALYLTVELDAVDAVLARYAGCAVARVDYVRERDDVTDRRERVNVAEGEGTHVDLFIARDASVVERARVIYRSPKGPSEHLAEMGQFLGYPACCVRAFEALADRSNNTAIRYAAWTRTLGEGRAFAGELNNLFVHVIPFYPCTYACPEALAHTRAVLEAYASRAPDDARKLSARMARPVFYVDHARQVGLGGARRHGAVIRYDVVYTGMTPEPDAGGASARFEAAMSAVFARGNGVTEDGERLVVLADERPIATLTRRAPGLGRIFPFGV